MSSVAIPISTINTRETTGNVLPLLHEIKHALSEFVKTGETTILDLRAIPMTPVDEEEIEKILGAGELRAILESSGKSEISETIYPGVWLITHYNENKQKIAQFIEVTSIPGIMKSQQEDVVAGIERLTSKLSDLSDLNEAVAFEESP